MFDLSQPIAWLSWSGIQNGFGGLRYQEFLQNRSLWMTLKFSGAKNYFHVTDKIANVITTSDSKISKNLLNEATKRCVVKKWYIQQRICNYLPSASFWQYINEMHRKWAFYELIFSSMKMTKNHAAWLYPHYEKLFRSHFAQELILKEFCVSP